MNKVIVDTNAFLRFLLNDIPPQKNAVERLFEQARKSGVTLLVPQIVVFELDFILNKYYHFNKEKIIEALSVLLATDFLEIESKQQFFVAVALYKEENVSLADCFLVATARMQSVELFTFDKKLKKLSST